MLTDNNKVNQSLKQDKKSYLSNTITRKKFSLNLLGHNQQNKLFYFFVQYLFKLSLKQRYALYIVV